LVTGVDHDDVFVGISAPADANLDGLQGFVDDVTRGLEYSLEVAGLV